MASKPHQTRKQELLEELNGKRQVIGLSASNLKSAVVSAPVKAEGTGKALLSDEAKERVSPNQESKLSAKTFWKLADNPGAKKLLSLKSRGNGLVVNERVSTYSKALTKKPVLLIVGVSFLVAFLFGVSKKKKKAKQNKVAKQGASILLFKWVLSASQPAMKHIITKAVKERFKGA